MLQLLATYMKISSIQPSGFFKVDIYKSSVVDVLSYILKTLAVT